MAPTDSFVLLAWSSAAGAQQTEHAFVFSLDFASGIRHVCTRILHFLEMHSRCAMHLIVQYWPMGEWVECKPGECGKLVNGN